MQQSNKHNVSAEQMHGNTHAVALTLRYRSSEQLNNCRFVCIRPILSVLKYSLTNICIKLEKMIFF